MTEHSFEDVWQSVVALRDDWRDETHRGLCQELGHIADALQDLRDTHERGVSYEWACRIFDLAMRYNRLFDHEHGDGPTDLLYEIVGPLVGVSVPTDDLHLKLARELGNIILRGALKERPYLDELRPGQRVIAELSVDTPKTGGTGVAGPPVMKLCVVKWRHWNTASKGTAYFGVVEYHGVDRYVPAHRLWDYDAEMEETTRKLLRAKLGQHGIMELFLGPGTKKDYPWGSGDNDNYLNKCSTCEAQYRGHKHSTVCAECQAVHKEWWLALTPQEQEKHKLEAMAELQRLLSERKPLDHV